MWIGYFSTDCVCGAGVRYLVFEVREQTGRGDMIFVGEEGKEHLKKNYHQNKPS